MAFIVFYYIQTYIFSWILYCSTMQINFLWKYHTGMVLRVILPHYFLMFTSESFIVLSQGHVALTSPEPYDPDQADFRLTEVHLYLPPES